MKPSIKNPGPAGKRALRCLWVMLLGWGLIGCSNSSPPPLGLVAGQLQPCPGSPNCVSSEATDAAHQIDPFQVQTTSTQAWIGLQEVVTALPGTQIVTVTEDYLHAECRSAVFGFIDDLELQLLPQQQQIAVRSAARLVYYDFGVNRKRAEELRHRSRAAGLIREQPEQATAGQSPHPFQRQPAAAQRSDRVLPTGDCHRGLLRRSHP